MEWPSGDHCMASTTSDRERLSPGGGYALRVCQQQADARRCQTMSNQSMAGIDFHMKD